MAVTDGSLLRIYLNGVAIAYATSSTINLSSEVDVLAPTSSAAAAWENIAPRRKKGTISTNALYGTSLLIDWKQLYDAWDADTLIAIAWRSTLTGEWSITGNAYITSLSATGAVSQDATHRATFRFSGDISIAELV